MFDKYVYEQVKLIENEFPDLEKKEIIMYVLMLIALKGIEKYKSMIENDRFDYLVDKIIKMQNEF